MGKDRISKLPDDILISILSRLPLADAAASVLISSRWQYLYTYTFGLNFPPFKAMAKNVGKESRIEAQKKRFPSYINMINRVLDSQKGDAVKEFRLRMPCWPGANFDRWLEFAFSSKAENIDIDMSCNWKRENNEMYYSLRLANMMKGPLPLPLRALKCLKQVSLSSVGVDDGELHLLLSNTPLLESLSIELSHVLTNVCILDHSLLLKHLGILNAFNLKTLKLGNLIKLVSLSCCDLPVTCEIRFYNLPNLIELSTIIQHYDKILWRRIIYCIGYNQLEILRLSISCLSVIRVHGWFPKLKKLKRLEVEVGRMSNNTYDYDELSPLIEACCSLESFEIKNPPTTIDY